MMANVGYLSLLGAVAMSIFLAWRRSLPRSVPALPVWRRRLLLLGVFANFVSLALFLVVSFGPQLVRNWTPDVYHYRLSLLVTLGSVVLGAFGRRVPRALVIVNGAVLAFLWFNLAAWSL